MLALALSLLLTGAVLAQTPAEPKAWFQADRTTLTVGDRVLLALFVQAPADAQPQFPELPPQWGDFEVLEQRDRAPQKDKAGAVISGREYVVTLFAPGDYVTPDTTVSLRDAAGAAIALMPQPLSLTVTSVLTDTAQTDLRDLKPQVELPFNWRTAGWIALGVLGAAALALAGVILARRLRRPARVVAPAPVIDTRPPEEIAYAELTRIEELHLVEAGDVKQHYSLTADCLRRYLGGLYGAPALDRTTDELARLLRRRRADASIARAALDILEESDLVKFAKARPPAEEARGLVGRVRAFVDRTRPATAPAGGAGQ